MEMLYLVEAKSAAMEASRHLNQRLQSARVAAEEQAFTDTLTGLKNHRIMDHVLERVERAGTKFALMHIDLDFFQAINDSLGHAAGDYVLQVAAGAMVDETRSDDTVAWMGWDQFVILFRELTDKRTLGSIERRLIARIEEPVMFNSQACAISA